MAEMFLLFTTGWKYPVSWVSSRSGWTEVLGTMLQTGERLAGSSGRPTCVMGWIACQPQVRRGFNPRRLGMWSRLETGQLQVRPVRKSPAGVFLGGP